MKTIKCRLLKLLFTTAILVCGLQNCLWAERILLTGATVHTISGETLSPGDVLFEGDRILEVGASISDQADKTIDLTGGHLYPGLIAPTSELGLMEIDAVRATLDTTEVGRFTPDVFSWIAVNPDSELIPVARANGITHALAVPSGGTVSGLSGLIQLDGWTTEQMTFQAPTALHLFWPSMRLDTRPKSELRDASNWKSLDDQAKERRKRISEIDEFFDQAEAYAKAVEAGGDSFDELERNPVWDAMLPLLEKKIPLMIHANELRQIKAGVEWAAKRNYDVIIAGGRDAWKIADLLAEKKIGVIFEHTFTLPDYDVESYDVHFRAPEILHQAGVMIAFSEGLSEMAAATVRNLPYQAAQAVAFGLPEDEALKAITLNPAKMLRVDDRLGSIEPGKQATFFVADGSILDIRSNVTHLWIAGREMDLSSRHTRLYEKYKNRPKAE